MSSLPRLVFKNLPLLLALSTPFLTLMLFPGRIFSIDFESFSIWAKCLTEFKDPPFGECAPQIINYPTIGLYSSAGAIKILQSYGLQGSALQRFFQVYLGAVDALSLLLMYLLLRGLRISHAAWATLIFALLPSTRVGANLWGQIDGVTQLFLSAAMLFGLRCLTAMHRYKATTALRYFSALSLAITCAVLTKQLAVFTLPALGALWLMCAARLRNVTSPTTLAARLTCLVAGFVAIDQLFPAPPGYYGSGLIYVFMRGSNHASTVQAMGTNLFALLPVPGHEPSTWAYPVFTLGGVTAKVIPLYFGQFVFFFAMAIFMFFGVVVVRRLRPLEPRSTFLAVLAMAAAANLFMNTALAGTHERYLYHYGFFLYPLLLALVHMRWVSWALYALCLTHLCAYGCFVFRVLIFNLTSPLTWYAQRAVALANIGSSLIMLLLVVRAARRGAENQHTRT
jgi:hypothetical protein